MKMNNVTVSTFMKSALMRMIHTMAQTAVSMITVGAALSEIDWLNILSVTAVAGIISFLKSIVAGTPETSVDGTVDIHEDASQTAYEFQFKDMDVAALKSGKVLKLAVQNNLGKSAKQE